MVEDLFRSLEGDVLKSPREQKRIFNENLKCTVDGCDNPLTEFRGPGQDSCCRDHQIGLVEYGNYGRIGRNHTFHRSDTCQCCKRDINDDPRWKECEEYFGVTLTERQKNEIKRRYNHGDHDRRKADGGDNSEENINAYCSFCHWVKTTINDDGRR